MPIAAQLEEYKMLHADIQQRIRFRFQLFGSLLTVGLLHIKGEFDPDRDLTFLVAVAILATIFTLIFVIAHLRIKR